MIHPRSDTCNVGELFVVLNLLDSLCAFFIYRESNYSSGAIK